MFTHRTKLSDDLKGERSRCHGGVQRALGERGRDLCTDRTETARDLKIRLTGIENCGLQVHIGQLQGSDTTGHSGLQTERAGNPQPRWDVLGNIRQGLLQGVQVELIDRDAAIERNGVDIIQPLADRPGLHVQADIVPVREDRGVKFETHRLVQTHIVRPQVELSHLKIRPGLLVDIANIAILDIEEGDQEQQGRGTPFRCLLVASLAAVFVLRSPLRSGSGW